MGSARSASNAVVYAVEKVLDLYGVQHTREQSRVIQVEGAAGRWRPMYFGRWVDDFGKSHSSGRADILARPRIPFHMPRPLSVFTSAGDKEISIVTVPLWIECKSGKGRLSPDQIAFKSWVESNGDHFLLIHDDVSPLLDWLTRFAVRKDPKKIIHAEPMDLSQVAELPCRHCKDKKADHKGSILACASRLGKVYSPDMKVKP